MYSDSDNRRIDGSEGVGPHEVHRGAFRKDYARLIHAPAFRRLQNKTQLFPGLESDFFRNRLTHSLEVAQIAGGIAHVLNATQPSLMQPEGAIDIDLVQFAGAAHDLGHPPFGHNGEKALDDAMKEYGGFEGNAQTLRILARLEKKKELPASAASSKASFENADSFGRLGLNLCHRSLAAVLKYDKQIPEQRSAADGLAKGYYASEARLIANIKQAVAPGLRAGETFKTVECQIMDVADDIAYSTYDLEDTLKGGFLSPMQMLREVEASQALVAAINDDVLAALRSEGESHPEPVTQDEIVGVLNDMFFQESDSKSVDRFAIDRQYVEDGYVRTALTAWMVGELMGAVEFQAHDTCPALSGVRLRSDARRLMEILKHLSFHLVIRAPRLTVVQYRGYDLVKKLFEALTTSKGRDLLPHDVRELHDRSSSIVEQRRVVCDFIAGMTDRYAVEFYGRLYGGDQTIFKPF